ncbi:MAG: shikimate kinase [Niabella sp.]|nr:shikimate kinase [Niabella sp.]
MRIYLIGFMGAGKTHWGKQLSKKMELPYYDLDDLVIESEGKPINQIFEEDGEEYFRMREKEVLHMITESHPDLLLSCGGGAPCFFNNIDYMNAHGVTVWLNTPFDILLGRLRQQRMHRPLLKDLDDEQLHAYIVKKTNDRRMYYEQAKLKVDDTHIKPDEFVKKIMNA